MIAPDIDLYVEMGTVFTKRHGFTREFVHFAMKFKVPTMFGHTS